MKNTFISLDLIWLNHNFNIVYLIENTTPLSMVVITPKQDASYVLEVNHGTIRKYQLKVGDQLNLIY